MLPGSINSVTNSTGVGSTPKNSEIDSHNDLNMLSPSMPNICCDEATTFPAETLLGQKPPLGGRPERKKPALTPLTVEIPVKRKVTVVELSNPYNREPISARLQPPQSGSPVFLEKKVWERTRKALITASHTSFTSKYSIKVELHDAKSKVLGSLETDKHHNPGHFCFFCLDYLPENFKVNKGMSVSRISPYCNCFTKTINDYDPEIATTSTNFLGKIKSLMCSNKTNIYNKDGDLAYSLNNGNGFLRNWRFLIEPPCLPLCIPYKIATYCCMDTFWRGKSKEMKLYDYKNAKEVVIGIVTNHGERANEWQEVIRNGEKITQYKGEEVFMCKEFEVNMPEDADEDLKKLIIGALIAELPSTVDRCAC